MEEHSIVVRGDALIGNYSELSYGVIAKSVVAGEHVKINGSIISEGDVRIDMWSEITGDIRTQTDAYLGEFVNITGKLHAAGNLDVGKSVKISHGYDVKGWLVVRNPIPVFMFVLLYLMALLRMGSEEEVEKALSELFSEEAPESGFLSIPDKTKITLETIRTTSPVMIGSHCRLLGNIRSRSSSMGNHVTLFGSIRSTGDITIGQSCIIHGNLISTKGKVTVGRNSNILGKISGENIIIHETSKIGGDVIAKNGVTTERDDLEGLDETGKKVFYGFMMLEEGL